jgi:long-chain acyl-CoA synthetase
LATNTYSDRPWLALYPADFARELTPKFHDMLSAFEAAVSHSPGHVAIQYFDGATTYEELDRSSNRIAFALSSRGVGQGDRVSIITQNIPAFAEVVVAAWKIGAVPVPSNPLYRPSELSKVFADCAPSVIICEGALDDTIREALMMAKHAAAVLLVSPHDRQAADDSRVLPPRDAERCVTPWLYSEAVHPPGTRRIATPDDSDLGLLLYTSGTTGAPKGVMIRHDSLAFNAQAMGAWGGVNSTSRVLGIAPLFHITGFVSHLAMCIVARCTLILHYRFESRVVLDVIRKTRPTYVVGAITAFNALMNTDGACKEDFESFDAVYSGGAAIAPALAETIGARLGVSIRPCYGMTETTSPSHATPPGLRVPVDPESGAMAVGIPIFSTEAMIVNENGGAVPVGERGELWLRGPQIMAGYWNKPEETAEALSEGWMRSGDIAFMDAAGWFYLVDRKKDMINASGFKVWPREVEDCLHQHSAVREAAVVGAPDPYRGENVVAYISLRPGETTTSEDLTAFCRERLTGYKCPRRFEILDELPKTITGKIQRNVVRAMAIRLTQ